MRWQRLFADLQAEFETLEASADRSEDAERARFEIGAVRLAQRLGGAVGRPVVLRCRGVGEVRAELVEVGSGWLLLTEGGRREVLVAAAAICAVTGMEQATALPEEGVVARRLDLRWALRGLARDRSPVNLALADGSALAGTLDRVGADFLELAEHAPAEPRRGGSVRGVWAVPIDAVSVVRRLEPGLG